MVKRLAPLVAGAGVMFAAVALVAGQLDRYADPVNTTLHASGGTALALALLGMAALALVAGMRAQRAPVGGWPELLIGAWAVTQLIAAMLPEVVWQVVTFTLLPAAAAQLVGRFADDERWRPVARPMEWLTLAAGLGVAALTYAALPGEGVMAGLAERALLAVEVAVLAVLAARLIHLTWSQIPTTVTSLTFRNMSLTRSK